MGCGFCATGQAGFTRQLTTGRDRRTGRRSPRRVPVASAGGCRTWCSWGWVSRWPTRSPSGLRSSGSTARIGLSARHLTISTVGVVPGHPRAHRASVAGQPRRVAPRRERHVARRVGADQPPIPARRADGCVQRLPRAQGPPVSFEWALIDGVNDRRSDAVELAELCRSLPLPRPRQPDPAQPDAGLADRRARRRRGCSEFRDRARPRWASTPPSAATGAPTSMPPAVNWPPVSPSTLRPTSPRATAPDRRVGDRPDVGRVGDRQLVEHVARTSSRTSSDRSSRRRRGSRRPARASSATPSCSSRSAWAACLSRPEDEFTLDDRQHVAPRPERGTAGRPAAR